MTNNLKRIAEAMGYEPVLSEAGLHCTLGGGLAYRKDGFMTTYNPKTNPAQLIELEDWLLNRACVLDKYDHHYCWMNSSRESRTCKNRALAAIDMALLEIEQEAK